MTSKNGIRKAAQKAFTALDACEACGLKEGLSRHHPDYSRPLLVEILCRSCHVKADQRDGFRKTKQAKSCAVCAAPFLPSHSKKHKTCSAKCLSELGRQNAAKRWTRGHTENGPESQESHAA